LHGECPGWAVRETAGRGPVDGAVGGVGAVATPRNSTAFSAEPSRESEPLCRPASHPPIAVASSAKQVSLERGPCIGLDRTMIVESSR
jgi:hypothetical protein